MEGGTFHRTVLSKIWAVCMCPFLCLYNTLFHCFSHEFGYLNVPRGIFMNVLVFIQVNAKKKGVVEICEMCELCRLLELLLLDIARYWFVVKEYIC